MHRDTKLLETPSMALEDGFHELSCYSGHNLPVLGLVLSDESSHTLHSAVQSIDQFLTWDMKKVHIWKLDRISNEPKTIKVIKFTKEKSHFIVAVAYISRHRMYVLSTADFCFKLYDRDLNLLESIQHEERAVLSLEYVDDLDVLVISGVKGVSIWKINRKLSDQQTYFIFEKQFSFSELYNVWVKKLVYEVTSRYIYAFVDRSVYVLSCSRKQIIHKLENIHDDPVTACIWYSRSQIFLTGCTYGRIKCLSSTKSLLHQFNIHSAAVTALSSHPVPGFAISASADGHIMILNVENYTVIFDTNTFNHILSMKTVFTRKRSSLCIVPYINGTIQLWDVTSCADFFASVSANIISFIHQEKIPCYVRDTNYLNNTNIGTDNNWGIEIIMNDATTVHRKFGNNTIIGVKQNVNEEIIMKRGDTQLKTVVDVIKEPTSKKLYCYVLYCMVHWFVCLYMCVCVCVLVCVYVCV